MLVRANRAMALGMTIRKLNMSVSAHTRSLAVSYTHLDVYKRQVLWERRKTRKTMEEIEKMLDAAMTLSLIHI